MILLSQGEFWNYRTGAASSLLVDSLRSAMQDTIWHTGWLCALDRNLSQYLCSLGFSILLGVHYPVFTGDPNTFAMRILISHVER